VCRFRTIVVEPVAARRLAANPAPCRRIINGPTNPPGLGCGQASSAPAEGRPLRRLQARFLTITAGRTINPLPREFGRHMPHP
jgi:hypothetical protein